MAKSCVTIGYTKTVETVPGVWTEEKVERQYIADINKGTMRYRSSEQLNDNFELSNEISIISDSYAIENFHNMRYVFFSGASWKITSISVQYPRLNITVGGLYNG